MSDRPRLALAVFGLINAGKSSLINALIGEPRRETGPIGGTTRDVADVPWSPPAGLDFELTLVDTPGLEEVGDESSGLLAAEAATAADLVVFVIAEDLTESALKALQALGKSAKPLLVALNKTDLLAPDEEASILGAIRSRLDGLVPADDIVPIAAAPIVRVRSGGVTVATRGEPRIGPLVDRLTEVVAESGSDFVGLNAARAEVKSYTQGREIDRATRRERAERVADETAVGLALALAVNPVPLIDFLTGPGGLAVLASRVAHAYGERPSLADARALGRELLKGGRIALRGSVVGVLAGGALKILPGIGHLAGATAQAASAGYLAHVLGRALVDYHENGHDWGDGGLVAALDRIASTADRRAITRGLVDRLKARLHRSESTP